MADGGTADEMPSAEPLQESTGKQDDDIIIISDVVEAPSSHARHTVGDTVEITRVKHPSRERHVGKVAKIVAALGSEVPYQIGDLYTSDPSELVWFSEDEIRLVQAQIGQVKKRKRSTAKPLPAKIRRMDGSKTLAVAANTEPEATVQEVSALTENLLRRWEMLDARQQLCDSRAHLSPV